MLSVGARDAGNLVEADHRERQSAHQHGEAGDLGRQIGAQAVQDTAERQLHQSREHGHAGDERQAALPGRENADREIDARERSRHEKAGTQSPRLQAEQDRAETERQHADRHQVLGGVMRCPGGVQDQQRKEHADRGGDEDVLQGSHPQHEARRAFVDAVDQLCRLDRRPALLGAPVSAPSVPEFEYSCRDRHHLPPLSAVTLRPSCSGKQIFYYSRDERVQFLRDLQA